MCCGPAWAASTPPIGRDRTGGGTHLAKDPMWHSRRAQTVTPSDAATLYLHAVRSNAAQLQSACIRRIAMHPQEAKLGAQWADLDESARERIRRDTELLASSKRGGRLQATLQRMQCWLSPSS